MAKYLISDAQSGSDLGTYIAGTQAAALELLASQRGYANYAAMAAASGPDAIVVDRVDSYRLLIVRDAYQPGEWWIRQELFGSPAVELHGPYDATVTAIEAAGRLAEKIKMYDHDVSIEVQSYSTRSGG